MKIWRRLIENRGADWAGLLVENGFEEGGGGGDGFGEGRGFFGAGAEGGGGVGGEPDFVAADEAVGEAGAHGGREGGGGVGGRLRGRRSD
jgi:hypothetical protein